VLRVTIGRLKRINRETFLRVLGDYRHTIPLSYWCLASVDILYASSCLPYASSCLILSASIQALNRPILD